MKKLVFACLLLSEVVCSVISVDVLSPGQIKHCCNDSQDLHFKIYCYESSEKSFFSVWQFIKMNISLNSSDYFYYEGNSAQNVIDKFENPNSYWLFINHFLPDKKNNNLLNPFESRCVGISTNMDYSISFVVDELNYHAIYMFIVGFKLFIFAPVLCVNRFFHYICSIMFGTILVILLPIYYLLKKVKTKAYFIASTIGLLFSTIYTLKIVFNNAELISENSSKYALVYLIISTMITFIASYLLGPVTDFRTKKIVEWIISAIGIIFMYDSSNLPEVVSIFIALLVTFRVLPGSYFAWPFRKRLNIFKPWKRDLPIRTRLLTEEEFNIEGEQETRRSLEELKQYFRRSDINAWSIIKTLKDPIKFVEFLDTGSHISLEERELFNGDIS